MLAKPNRFTVHENAAAVEPAIPVELQEIRAAIDSVSPAAIRAAKARLVRAREAHATISKTINDLVLENDQRFAWRAHGITEEMSDGHNRVRRELKSKEAEIEKIDASIVGCMREIEAARANYAAALHRACGGSLTWAATSFAEALRKAEEAQAVLDAFNAAAWAGAHTTLGDVLAARTVIRRLRGIVEAASRWRR
jgi:hypothetical protein